MSVDRAKIFLPFAALGGLEEALRAKEFTPVAQAELSADRAEEIDHALRDLAPGMQVRLVFYAGEAYNHLTGLLAAIDPRRRCLTVGDAVVPFDALLEPPEPIDP